MRDTEAELRDPDPCRLPPPLVAHVVLDLGVDDNIPSTKRS